MDLYRVGTPSIGEVWLRRFQSNRSTGGLGTGVYAFRDRIPAEENVGVQRGGKDVFEMQNALENPLEITSLSATEKLVRVSRALSMFAERVIANPPDYDDAIREIRDGSFLNVNPLGGIGTPRGFPRHVSFAGELGDSEVLWGSEEVDRRDSLQSMVREVLSDTFSFSILDAEDFTVELIEATREAERRADQNPDAAVQPINIALYPEYDGIAPRNDAGGNTGKHGCVIFKQKIDECVGRETEQRERIDAQALNDCFLQSDSQV